MIYTLTANPSLDKLFIIDKLLIGQYNRGEIARYDPGGKGINVSRCLKALGINSEVLGFFAGSTGEFLINSLRLQGLMVDPIMIKGESRSNITLIESSTGQMTKLNEYGPIVDQEAYRYILKKISEKTQRGDIWVLSGSVSPGLPDDFYVSIIEVIRKYGGLAFLDTSDKWLIHGFKAVPDLLRINTAEVQMALNKKLTTREELYEAIKMVSKTGIFLTVVSMGSQGALFADATYLYDVTAPKVEEKTSIGAGDAMMAMIIYGYIHGWSSEKIAAWSVAAGSASVMQVGTATVTRDQIEPLLDKVEVKKIDYPFC